MKSHGKDIDEADDYSNEFLISKDIRDFKVSCIFCDLNHWDDDMPEVQNPALSVNFKLRVNLLN